MSGQINKESHDKRYSFIKDQAKEYLDKWANLKKDKKIKDEKEYDLYKKQINYVKGWMKNKSYTGNQKTLESEMKHENKKRESEGKNPIYLKKNQIKHIVQETYKEKRNSEDQKKFLKRKMHRDIVKTRKIERSGRDLK